VSIRRGNETMYESSMYDANVEVASATVHRSADHLYTINLSHEPDFHHVKLLLQNLLTFLIKYVNKEQILYLDVDVSNGLWDSIGMKSNRYVNRLGSPLYGYEKCITVDDLLRFVSL